MINCRIPKQWKALLLWLLAFHVNAIAQVPARLSDYWAGNAQWDLVSKWTQDQPKGATSNTSSKIRIVNNTWYLFQREIIATPTGCNSSGIAVRVYSSTDKGLNWTAASSLSLAPTAGTDFSCMVTDGDAFYDAAANKWIALFQCLGNDAVWRGCYFERAGADPMGPFDYQLAARARAVITPGMLWSQICNNYYSKCAGRNVTDEGTFDIILKDSEGYFWVSFHGFSNPYGYRGLAKTKNFSSWFVGNSAYGVPSDAILSPYDGQSWREAWAAGGPIGAGNSSTIEEDGLFYQLAEIPDINLGCVAGQHWDLGLFRTSSLASTQWEQFPLGNPIFYSSLATEPVAGSGNVIRPCNTQYGQIFKDTSVNPPVIYAKFGRETAVDPSHNGTFLYRLNKVSNLLKNGNLWMGDGYWYQRLPTGSAMPNLAVYRWPNMSPDGNQFLATNCSAVGTGCASGSSFYQDIPATAYVGRTITYGGKFATSGGNGGNPSLALWQLDANYAPLKADTVVLSVPGTTYLGAVSQPITILPGTKILRYQFYHAVSTVTYFAGNMFVNLQ
jgi:hypothetical protein